jgi:hypothetical protein
MHRHDALGLETKVKSLSVCNACAFQDVPLHATHCTSSESRVSRPRWPVTWFVMPLKYLVMLERWWSSRKDGGLQCVAQHFFVLCFCVF